MTRTYFDVLHIRWRHQCERISGLHKRWLSSDRAVWTPALFRPLLSRSSKDNDTVDPPTSPSSSTQTGVFATVAERLWKTSVSSIIYLGLFLTAMDVVRHTNHWCFPQPSALVVKDKPKHTRTHTHTHTQQLQMSQYIMKRFLQTSGTERGAGGEFMRGSRRWGKLGKKLFIDTDNWNKKKKTALFLLLFSSHTHTHTHTQKERGPHYGIVHWSDWCQF